MSHPRQLIREAVQDLLSGETDAEDRVYKTRVVPYRESELPIVAIYMLEESVEQDKSSGELTRSADMVIEAIAEAIEGRVDDELDDIAQQIEDAIDVDLFMGGNLAEAAALDNTTLEVLEDGEKLLGLVTLTYKVVYRTLAAEDADDADEFLRVKATHQPVGVGETEEVEDQFNVREVP